MQTELDEKVEEMTRLTEGYERLKEKLDEKDVLIEKLKGRLDEKDALQEKLKGRLNEKDALLEKLKSRLDEKDGAIGDLSARLEALQSDRWEKLDSNGTVTEMIEKLKTALFESE